MNTRRLLFYLLVIAVLVFAVGLMREVGVIDLRIWLLPTPTVYPFWVVPTATPYPV